MLDTEIENRIAKIVERLAKSVKMPDPQMRQSARNAYVKELYKTGDHDAARRAYRTIKEAANA